MSERLPAKLYLVGTPIGNMGDMSARAIETLSSVDTILCEDTRQTSKLCARFGISRPLVRCDENVMAQMTAVVLSRLKDGESFAFVSDAGMPCISDPGQRLVDAALNDGLAVEVIPGPTALSSALAASGLNSTAFLFDGFLPRKLKARRERIQELLKLGVTLIFYESPKRLVQSLEDLAKLAPNSRVCVARELTKIHEEVLRGTAQELVDVFSSRDEVKGECVILLEPSKQDSSTTLDEESLKSEIAAALQRGESKSSLAKRLSAQTELSRSELYKLILEFE